MGEWIRVEDRLPRYNRHVLTFTPTMAMPIVVDQYCGYWGDDDDDEWYEGWWSKRKITHWMPLPEPPKGENDG